MPASTCPWVLLHGCSLLICTLYATRKQTYWQQRSCAASKLTMYQHLQSNCKSHDASHFCEPASQPGTVTPWSHLLHGSKCGREVLLLLASKLLQHVKIAQHGKYMIQMGCHILCCRTKAAEEVVMVQLSTAAQLTPLSCSKHLH